MDEDTLRRVEDMAEVLMIQLFIKHNGNIQTIEQVSQAVLGFCRDFHQQLADDREAEFESSRE